MKKPPRIIHFGGGTPWAAESDQAHERRAQNPELPNAVRLVELAKARANVYGHAAFRPGEVRKLLTDKVGRPANRTQLYKELERAKCWEDLAPVSTFRCLVLMREDWTRGSGKMTPCNEPTHDGHQWHEWLKDSGWGIWKPAEGQVATRARKAEPAAVWFDLEGGFMVDGETGETFYPSTGGQVPVLLPDVSSVRRQSVVSDTTPPGVEKAS